MTQLAVFHPDPLESGGFQSSILQKAMQNKASSIPTSLGHQPILTPNASSHNASVGSGQFREEVGKSSRRSSWHTCNIQISSSFLLEGNGAARLVGTTWQETQGDCPPSHESASLYLKTEARGKYASDKYSRVLLFCAICSGPDAYMEVR